MPAPVFIVKPACDTDDTTPMTSVDPSWVDCVTSASPPITITVPCSYSASASKRSAKSEYCAAVTVVVSILVEGL